MIEVGVERSHVDVDCEIVIVLVQEMLQHEIVCKVSSTIIG